MYEHPDVQQFINSVSRSTLNANKEIYIAGTARKVVRLFEIHCH